MDSREEVSTDADSNLLPLRVAATCKAKSYAYAALEYSTQCRCGSSLETSGGGGSVVDSSKCSSNCGGELVLSKLRVLQSQSDS